MLSWTNVLNTFDWNHKMMVVIFSKHEFTLFNYKKMCQLKHVLHFFSNSPIKAYKYINFLKMYFCKICTFSGLFVGFIWRTRWPAGLLLWKSSARSGSVCVPSWCSLRGGSLVWGSTSHGRCSELLLALSSHEVKEKQASEVFSSGRKVKNNSSFLFL